MKLWTRASIALTTSAGLVFAGGFHATALPTDIRVHFDESVPVPGGTVAEGEQKLTGTAEAIEGFERLDLYVVAHRKPGTAVTGKPVASQVENVARAEVPFELVWSTIDAPAGVVDLVVVATTSTRVAQAEIPKITIPSRGPAVAKPSAPKPAPVPGAAAPRAPGGAAPAAVAPAKPAAVAPRPAAQAAPVPLRRVDPTKYSALSEEQARSFYEVFGAMGYSYAEPATVTHPNTKRALSEAPAIPWQRRIDWAPVALGLMLLAAAAFTARLAYMGPAETATA